MPRGQHGKGYNTAKATESHTGKIALEVPIDAEKRNKVPEIKLPGLRWYVCTTAPQQELRAAESLRAAKLRDEPLMLRAYVPCEFWWHRPVRSNLKMPRREYQRPRLRHYLFLGVWGGLDDETLAVLRQRDIEKRNVHGLVGILGSPSGKPLPFNNKGRDWIAEMAEDERAGRADVTAATVFDIGEAVKVRSGMFSMFDGIVAGTDGISDRVLVTLSLMGGADMWLDYQDVEKVA